MREQDRYIPGVPCWIDTPQADPAAAAAFYGDLFGWELEDVMPPGSPTRYYMARLGGGDVAAVSSMPEGGPEAAAWRTYVWVQDADETADKVRAAGGTVLDAPSDAAIGDASPRSPARRAPPSASGRRRSTGEPRSSTSTPRSTSTS